MLAVSTIPHGLLRRGFPLGPLALLETVGRRTGKVHTVPVVILRTRGEAWLISPFGQTAWLRNHRAGSPLRLGRGHNLQAIDLVDAPSEEVPELLRRYRRRFRLVPFVRAAFVARPGDDLGAFAAEADAHPVFRIVDAG